MNPMPKYTYAVESLWAAKGKWVALISGEARGFAYGYYLGRFDERSGPANALRLVRSDGMVVDSASQIDDVSIGMIAGMPSAEQYEGAAERALERARSIRAFAQGRQSRAVKGGS